MAGNGKRRSRAKDMSAERIRDVLPGFSEIPQIAGEREPIVIERRPKPEALRELSGVHRCIRCRNEVSAETFFRNDHVCEPCRKQKRHPLDLSR
jgi:hypothetical protein